MKKKQDDNIGEELYNVLAQVLNRPGNRKFFDCIRGEYGVLSYLASNENPVNAGTLKEKLHVVPGRMTDILTVLENKGFITRQKSDEDKRIVNVYITDSGREEALRTREIIHKDYEGLFKVLSYEDTKELVRLLKILLTYN